jgi:hypothetical protein
MQKIVFQGTADVKGKLLWGGCLALALSVTCAWQVLAMSEGKSDFPDGGDAVQAAPESHKIIFENAIVRVLEVPIPPVGKPEPMHHHRWPSLMLHWDTGGKSPHIRYHRSDGSVRDIPSKDTPIHPGQWIATWMSPEPMHWVETLDHGAGQEPPYIRVEIKIIPEATSTSPR